MAELPSLYVTILYLLTLRAARQRAQRWDAQSDSRNDVCIVHSNGQKTQSYIIARILFTYGQVGNERWRATVCALVYSPVIKERYISSALSWNNVLCLFHFETDRGKMCPAKGTPPKSRKDISQTHSVLAGTNISHRRDMWKWSPNRIKIHHQLTGTGK